MHSSETDMSIGTAEGRFLECYVDTDWGGLTAAFERVSAGFDTTPLFKELPEGNCQVPHWGYLLKGRMLIRYREGEEEIRAGEVYYLSPGHNVAFLEDSETVAFSPTNEHAGMLEIAKKDSV